MKRPTTKQFIISAISFFAGVMAMVGYNYYQSTKNEAPENAVEIQALALSAEYGKEIGFNLNDILNPLVFAPGYDNKNRCWVDYQVWGNIQLSHPQEIHTTVETKPGTPGGTTVTAESVDMDPQQVFYRVRSNRPLTEEDILLLYNAPEGWLPGKWTDFQILKTFQNCVVTKPDPQQIPNR
ncbi:MAG: hypothetical protein AAFO02_00610 [Bacteroidota bacterium]